ncbi:MAG: DnaB-like helicase C-terminal domain-containing protein [Myxococcota bacterium]
MQHQSAAEDLRQLGERPALLSTGLASVDCALRGGFEVGELSIVAARPKVGATSFLMGMALGALFRGHRVAYFSERLRLEQIRGRFVVLQSQVNGFRFRAGFVTVEDRLALSAARERIPWNGLSLVSQRQISIERIERQLFRYRPLLVVADVRPRAPGASDSRRLDALLEGIERLALVAQRQRVALVLHLTLNVGKHPPDLLELPGRGSAAQLAQAVVLLHRSTDESANPAECAEARAQVVRVGGKEVEPRLIPLAFDQRFAGLSERT